MLDVTQKLREAETVPDLWLCAAPIKKGRIDWVAEKACELGVARLIP
ncbi:16S rRNA (uracil(1498)-N(3))-methyltransferase, partial [Pseudomonas aeruginosa]